MTESSDKPSLWARVWFQNTMIIIFTAGIAYGMAAYEIVRRARLAYQEGEVHYSQGDYRKALWSYQEVLDFYTRPSSQWVEKARSKVGLCEVKLKDEDPVEALDKLFGLSVPKEIIRGEAPKSRPSDKRSQAPSAEGAPEP